MAQHTYACIPWQPLLDRGCAIGKGPRGCAVANGFGEALAAAFLRFHIIITTMLQVVMLLYATSTYGVRGLSACSQPLSEPVSFRA